MAYIGMTELIWASANLRYVALQVTGRATLMISAMSGRLSGRTAGLDHRHHGRPLCEAVRRDRADGEGAFGRMSGLLLRR